MRFDAKEIIYPDGDRQAINHTLSVNQIVDINGFPAKLPFSTPKTIAYRVYRKSTSDTRNEIITSFYLEQLTIDELNHLCH